MSEDHTCPTCGAPVIVSGNGSDRWYQPPVIDAVRLNVQPGDVLAVRLPGNTTIVERNRVVAMFEYYLPGIHVVWVGNEVSFAVLSNDIVTAATQDGAKP